MSHIDRRGEGGIPIISRIPFWNSQQRGKFRKNEEVRRLHGIVSCSADGERVRPFYLSILWTTERIFHWPWDFESVM